MSFTVSATLFAPTQKFFGLTKTTVIGLTLVAIGLVCIGQAHPAAVPPAAFLYVSGLPLFTPAVPILLMQCVPPTRRGTVMGVDSAINAIARIISPIVFGRVFAKDPALAFACAGASSSPPPRWSSREEPSCSALVRSDHRDDVDIVHGNALPCLAFPRLGLVVYYCIPVRRRRPRPSPSPLDASRPSRRVPHGTHRTSRVHDAQFPSRPDRVERRTRRRRRPSAHGMSSLERIRTRSSTISRRARERVLDKRVLELGAGVGACGLACASLGARAVCLTDRDEATLALAHGNAGGTDGSTATRGRTRAR